MAGPYSAVPILVTGDSISALFGNTYWGQNFDAVFGGLIPGQMVRLNSSGNAFEAAGKCPEIPYVGLYHYRSTTLATGANANLAITTEYDPYNMHSGGTITIPAGLGGRYRAIYEINANCPSTPTSGRIEVTWSGLAFPTLFMWYSEFWGVVGNSYSGMCFTGIKADGSTIVPVCNIYNGLNQSIQDCTLNLIIERLGSA
jgi:hypothetical protein